MIGLISRSAARLVEGDGAVQRAVVGDRPAIEAQRRRLADQVVDPPEAVEQAELRVDVEVGEVVRRDRRNEVPLGDAPTYARHRSPARRLSPNFVHDRSTSEEDIERSVRKLGQRHGQVRAEQERRQVTSHVRERQNVRVEVDAELVGHERSAGL